MRSYVNRRPHVSCGERTNSSISRARCRQAKSNALNYDFHQLPGRRAPWAGPFRSTHKKLFIRRRLRSHTRRAFRIPQNDLQRANSRRSQGDFTATPASLSLTQSPNPDGTRHHSCNHSAPGCSHATTQIASPSLIQSHRSDIPSHFPAPQARTTTQTSRQHAKHLFMCRLDPPPAQSSSTYALIGLRSRSNGHLRPLLFRPAPIIPLSVNDLSHAWDLNYAQPITNGSTSAG